MSSVRHDTLFDDVTLAILAGGEGSRMGMPKARITIASKPILEYLLDEIPWAGPTMLVTAPSREHPPGWRRFGMEVSDPQAGGGPLRGVLTALEHLATPLLLVLTVDMPGIRLPQCEAILSRLRADPSIACVMMRRMIDDSWQVEPFPCVLRAFGRPMIERRLSENRRSMHGLLEESAIIAMDAPRVWSENVWTNLNKPSDMAKSF